MNEKPLSLVTNPAAFIDRLGALKRQNFASASLAVNQPLWCHCRKAMLYEDYKHLRVVAGTTHLLKRSSANDQGTMLHLPFVRELMDVASYPIKTQDIQVSESDLHWRGILNNDTIIGPRFFAPFQTVEDAINCIFVRVWDVEKGPKLNEVPEQVFARRNFNSLEGLFLRDKAIEIFRDTYPDVIFGWAWDAATVLWATNNDAIRIHAIDDPEAAIHVVHNSPARAGGLGASDDVADYNEEKIRKYFKSR